MRAAAADQKSVALQQQHGQLIDTLIGGQPAAEVFFALYKRGRIDDDGAEPAAFVAQARVAPRRRYPATALPRRQAGSAPDFDPLQRLSGGVDKAGAGAAACSAETPCAGVAEHIEHALDRIAGEAHAIIPLVIEPAGLLPLAHRRHKLEGTLAHRHLLGHLAPGHLDVTIQFLELAGPAVVTPQDAGGRQLASDRIDDLALETLHRGRRALQHDDIAVAIRHQSRDAVGFAEQQSVTAVVVERVAQAPCHPHPMHEQWTSGRMVRVSGQHTGGDQRMRMDAGIAEKATPVADHTDDVAGFE